MAIKERIGAGGAKGYLLLAGLAVVAVLLLIAACGDDAGEDRPGIEVIDTPTGSVSVSVSGTGTGTGSATGTMTGTGTGTGTGTATGTMTGTGAVEPGVVRIRPPAATLVNVELKEWEIILDRNEVEAGAVYFLVSNTGPIDPHELVIIRTDLAPDQLPTVEGKVPEDQIDLIGEIEPYSPGTVASGVFNLQPGNYALICNIAEIEEGTLESHYNLGMYVAFTVTGTETSVGNEFYRPVSNVTSHAAISLDMRDIKALLANAKTGDPVDWATVTALYERGGNSISGSGSVRTLHSLANSDSVLAEFPGGANLDANVRKGLTGQWTDRPLDDNSRRNIVDKSIQVIIYGKVNQELSSARNQLEQGNTDDASGAPHKVDEGWAFYMGMPGDEANFPYSISAAARSREGNFGLDGLVDIPLQQALARALEASRAGDIEAYDAAAAEARGYLNTIFYLATLRYAAVAMNDDNETARQIHLAEGWAFYQALSPAVASAVPPFVAAQINNFFTQDPSNEIPESDVLQLYSGFNNPAITDLLGIPESVRVTSPDQLQ